MIIRKYGDIPATYAPDVTEVVEARKSPAGEYERAVVLHVSRTREGGLRVKVQWLTGPQKDAPGWIVTRPDGWPPMIRQIFKDQPPK